MSKLQELIYIVVYVQWHVARLLLLERLGYCFQHSLW